VDELQADRIDQVICEIAAQFGPPAQDTIVLNNQGKHRFEIGLMLGALPAGGRLLDVGGGMGVNLLCMKRLPRPLGETALIDRFVEYDTGNRMGPRDRGLALMHEAGILVHDCDFWRAHRLPLEADHFDLVTLLDVVEHLPGSPLQLLSEIRRVLRPGGRLILAGPNSLSALKRARLLLGTHPYTPFEPWLAEGYFGHYREYSMREYEALVRRVGFDLTSTVMIPEPTRTQIMHRHAYGRRHRALSAPILGLAGLRALETVFPSLRPAVYCTAVKPRVAFAD
jgi:SAM-dependent methyltransferase